MVRMNLCSGSSRHGFDIEAFVPADGSKMNIRSTRRIGVPQNNGFRMGGLEKGQDSPSFGVAGSLKTFRAVAHNGPSVDDYIIIAYTDVIIWRIILQSSHHRRIESLLGCVRQLPKQIRKSVVRPIYLKPRPDPVIFLTKKLRHIPAWCGSHRLLHPQLQYIH